MYKAIPEMPSIEGWKKVKIEEVEETLIGLSMLGMKQIHVEPFYFKKGVKHATNDCYVRDTVLAMLMGAVAFLPPSYKLVIWDAWRSVPLQEQIVEAVKTELEQKYPTFTEGELTLEIERIGFQVSYDKRKPSPAYTGGSIQVTLMNDKGELVDMGTELGTLKENTPTRFYEEKLTGEEALTKEEEVIVANRRMLYTIMTQAGFVNFPEQWSRYDFGNQHWAKTTGDKGMYGGIDL